MSATRNRLFSPGNKENWERRDENYIQGKGCNLNLQLFSDDRQGQRFQFRSQNERRPLQGLNSNVHTLQFQARRGECSLSLSQQWENGQFPAGSQSVPISAPSPMKLDAYESCPSSPFQAGAPEEAMSPLGPLPVFQQADFTAGATPIPRTHQTILANLPRPPNKYAGSDSTPTAAGLQSCPVFPNRRIAPPRTFIRVRVKRALDMGGGSTRHSAPAQALRSLEDMKFRPFNSPSAVTRSADWGTFRRNVEPTVIRKRISRNTPSATPELPRKSLKKEDSWDAAAASLGRLCLGDA